MSDPSARTRTSNLPPLVVGVDVGGSKVAAAVVEGNGAVRGRLVNPTNLTGPRETLEGISLAVTRAIEAAGYKKSDVSGVGLGIPGKVDPAAGIAVLSVNLGWRDLPIRDSLQDALGLPCFIENDVKAAALGELEFGAGRGLQNMIYLILGTGIAAGVIIDGRLYRGSAGMAGEIGHAVIDPKGPVCKCGAKGCLEAIASGPAIVARGALVAPPMGQEGAGKGESVSGPATAGAVFEAAARGEPGAVEVVRETCEYLGLALQWLIMAFDPQLVVLAGGVAQAGKGLLEGVRRELEGLGEASYVFREVFGQTSLRLSQLGVDAGVLGAAALAARSLGRMGGSTAVS
jgi:glucokinase